MKKFFVVCAAVAALMSSCQNSPKANIKSDIDSLSYAVGMAQTNGLKEYLVQRMGVDTTYLNEFIAGFNEAANQGADKKSVARFAGMQIGQQVSEQMFSGINNEVFGDDTTQTISRNNFLAGFIDGTKGDTTIMNVQVAGNMAQEMMQTIKTKHMMEQYGSYKKECEDFMAAIANKEGIQALENGVYYEVLKEGKGDIPTEDSKVKVHYEGRLINDSIFDSSYQRDEPTTFKCKQVIPGWTNALTHMPVGSTWMVYIPQDQAYGERQAGMIDPFSCLIFKIELLGIEK